MRCPTDRRIPPENKMKAMPIAHTPRPVDNSPMPYGFGSASPVLGYDDVNGWHITDAEGMIESFQNHEDAYNAYMDYMGEKS
jgi:hypothetical protein